MRTTKKQLNNMLKIVCKLLNLPYGYKCKNALHLDYASCYGGYRIEQISDINSTAINCPFGDNRYKAYEMYIFLRAIILTRGI